MVPPWALQKGTESRDPSLGWGVGKGSSQLCPRQGTWVQGARERFWGRSNLLPSSHLAKPRRFWHQGWNRGSGAGGLGPAGLCCGCCQLCHLHRPRASAGSQIWAPLLPAGPGLLTGEKGSKPQPTLPCLHCRSCLSLRHLPGAWEGLALPDVRAQLGRGRAHVSQLIF